MAKFCTSCGAALEENQEKCLSCGKVLNESSNSNQNTTNNTSNNQSYTTQTNYTTTQPKSKMAAGLLGIFLGSLGIHNFYLGYTGKAVAQLLLTVVGTWVTCGISAIAASIWGLVEGIMILTGSINKDGNGNPLGE